MLTSNQRTLPPICRHLVRVVKEADSKSAGLCPQGFESPRCRILSFFIASCSQLSPAVRDRLRKSNTITLFCPDFGGRAASACQSSCCHFTYSGVEAIACSCCACVPQQLGSIPHMIIVSFVRLSCWQSNFPACGMACCRSHRQVEYKVLRCWVCEERAVRGNGLGGGRTPSFRMVQGSIPARVQFPVRDSWVHHSKFANWLWNRSQKCRPSK